MTPFLRPKHMDSSTGPSPGLPLDANLRCNRQCKVPSKTFWSHTRRFMASSQTRATSLRFGLSHLGHIRAFPPHWTSGPPLRHQRPRSSFEMNLRPLSSTGALGPAVLPNMCSRAASSTRETMMKRHRRQCSRLGVSGRPPVRRRGIERSQWRRRTTGRFRTRVVRQLSASAGYSLAPPTAFVFVPLMTLVMVARQAHSRKRPPLPNHKGLSLVAQRSNSL